MCLLSLSWSLADKALTRSNTLGPLRPTAIIELLFLFGEAGLDKSCVNDGGGDASAAAVDDRLGGVDAFGPENSLELDGGEDGLGFCVEEVGDRDRGRVGDVSRGEAYVVVVSIRSTQTDPLRRYHAHLLSALVPFRQTCPCSSRPESVPPQRPPSPAPLQWP